MRIEIPEFSLVALVGATSSGKSTFARKHFKETEILSSDEFRAMISDDENDQTVTAAAFDTLYYVAEKRLDLMKLTVIDATNLQKSAREKILETAKEQNVHAVAIVLDLPLSELLARNDSREERRLPAGVINNHVNLLKRSIKHLRKEGFRYVYVLNGQDEIDEVEIVRTKLYNNKRELHGPFDLIGDVHGCADELKELLERLGYVMTGNAYAHPEGRTAVFIGDLTDRGPKNVEVLRIVMDMVDSGNALCTAGNHDNKLERWLSGRNVQITHGLEKTINELNAESDEFRNRVKEFLESLRSHYVLDDGNLVAAHAGIKEKYIGRGSARVRDFCLYGETTGESDEFGLPVRLDWAVDYRGKAMIVYGHTPVMQVKELNRTFCIDTGCVFGGSLSAIKYPEKETVSVPAKRTYYEPVRPIKQEPIRQADLLAVDDVMGKQFMETSLVPSFTIPEKNSAAAMEAASRFTVDPHWLIYLPPTMSPCETSRLENYLEYPEEAFGYYRNHGVKTVICEKKHMGSRAVIVLSRNQETAERIFHVSDGTIGTVYTRTGRRFFDNTEIECRILSALNNELDANGFWTDMNTDWVCLDAEIMPWNEKAQALLRTKYAPTGYAAKASLETVSVLLKELIARNGFVSDKNSRTLPAGFNPEELLNDTNVKKTAIDRYIKAYEEYCWTVNDISDLQIAPFHLLAYEGHTCREFTNREHMDLLAKYCCNNNSMFIATPYISVNVDDETSVQAGIEWWLRMTEDGGEGMVVKPEQFIAKENKHLLQPAIKCRGKEYLRIIYGPEYLIGDHLPRLKKRSLKRKRNLALREFALGMESLERFVAGEPLYQIHRYSFGVLALETEPVDPRL